MLASALHHPITCSLASASMMAAGLEPEARPGAGTEHEACTGEGLGPEACTGAGVDPEACAVTGLEAEACTGVRPRPEACAGVGLEPVACADAGMEPEAGGGADAEEAFWDSGYGNIRMTVGYVGHPASTILGVKDELPLVCCLLTLARASGLHACRTHLLPFLKCNFAGAPPDLSLDWSINRGGDRSCSTLPDPSLDCTLGGGGHCSWDWRVSLAQQLEPGIVMSPEVVGRATAEWAQFKCKYPGQSSGQAATDAEGVMRVLCAAERQGHGLILHIRCSL